MGLGLVGCLAENPLWMDTERGSGPSGGTTTTSAATTAPPGSTTSDDPSASSQTTGAMPDSSGGSTTGPPPSGIECGPPMTNVAVTGESSGPFTDFAVRSGLAEGLVAWAEPGQVGVATFDIGGAQPFTSPLPVMAQQVLLAGSLEEAYVAVDTTPSQIFSVRRTSASLVDFTVPVFPVEGLLVPFPGRFGILTRQLANQDSFARLTLVDVAKAGQTDLDLDRFGPSTWLISEEDPNSGGWVLFRTTNVDGCAILRLSLMGEPETSWILDDECFDPDIAVAPDGTALVVYHQITDGDRLVFARSIEPEGALSPRVRLGGDSSQESGPRVAVFPGGEFLVVWERQEQLAGQLLPQFPPEGDPMLIAPFGVEQGLHEVFTTEDGFGGAVFYDDEGTFTQGPPGIVASFLCGP